MSPRVRRVLGAVSLAWVAACGEEEGIGPDATCGLAVTLSGDVTYAVDSDTEVACLVQHSFEMGIDVEYAATSGAIDRFALEIAEVMKGQTGEFPATVRITRDDGVTFVAGNCTVTIDEHAFIEPDEFGEDYRARGGGECPGPAVDMAGGEITISPFEFVVVATWRL